SVCGRIKNELRLDERIYHCTCGNHMDRDVNAAVNIREEGRRILMAG
nr:transposase [Clostridium sp.]